MSFGETVIRKLYLAVFYTLRAEHPHVGFHIAQTFEQRLRVHEEVASAVEDGERGERRAIEPALQRRIEQRTVRGEPALPAPPHST